MSNSGYRKRKAPQPPTAQPCQQPEPVTRPQPAPRKLAQPVPASQTPYPSVGLSDPVITPYPVHHQNLPYNPYLAGDYSPSAPPDSHIMSVPSNTPHICPSFPSNPPPPSYFPQSDATVPKVQSTTYITNPSIIQGNPPPYTEDIDSLHTPISKMIIGRNSNNNSIASGTLSTVCPPPVQPRYNPIEELSSSGSSNQEPIQDEDIPASKATIVPFKNFDAKIDAHTLRLTLKHSTLHLKQDGAVVAKILPNRSMDQRQLIKNEYSSMFGHNLIEDLKSYYSGNLKKLALALMTPLTKYYAEVLHDALKGPWHADLDALIDVFCIIDSNTEMNFVKTEFQKLYGKKIDKMLESAVTGNFARLMDDLCSATRDESNRADLTKSLEDAHKLHGAEADSAEAAEVFRTILTKRNHKHLKEVFIDFKKISGHDIEVAIERKFSGHFAKGLLTIVKVVRNLPDYYAERLHKIMKGLTTDHNALIRILVTRGEIDMVDIKNAIIHKYTETLMEWIEKKCHGDYKRCLLNITSNKIFNT